MAAQTGTPLWRQRSGPLGTTSGQGCVGLKPGDVRKGLIARLPEKTKIPQQSRVFVNQEVNDGAFNHPCLIIDHSPDKSVVFCLQVTSFGGEKIQDKYGPDRCNSSWRDKILDDYVAFDETGTLPHNKLGLLEYQGRRMDLQSYAHLEFGFWIEREYLEMPHFRLLKGHSLLLVKDLHSKASVRIQTRGSESISRLANAEQRRNRSASPLLSSVPIVASRPNHQSSGNQPKRVSSLGKRDFETFDTGLQQSGSVQTIVTTQKPAANLLKSWRRDDQNAPPCTAKRIAMAGNWRIR